MEIHFNFTQFTFIKWLFLLRKARVRSDPKEIGEIIITYTGR